MPKELTSPYWLLLLFVAIAASWFALIVFFSLEEKKLV